MHHDAPPGWDHAPSATCGSVGEHALIRWITSVVGTTSNREVLLGIGDDAALVAPRRNHVDVLTTDVQVEGVHFTRAISTAADVGHRALHVNLSDIAAMGGMPRLAMLSLGLPASLEARWVADLVHALVQAARAAGVHLVGGNISRSPALFVDVTVTGAVKPRHVLRRSGARAGDELYVSGEVGAAAAGLAWLTREDAAADTYSSERLETAMLRYRRPEARVGLGTQVGRNKAASACMDTSDGLADALRQLDDQTVERGDIVVQTEEQAKALSQPRTDAQGRPIRIEAAPRVPPRGNVTPVQASPLPATTPAPAAEGSEQPDPKRQVRTVGPTYLPGR